MEITEKQILKLKEEVGEVRDKIISAKSTLESVEKNIKNYTKELEKLGVKEGEEDEAIEKLRAEIEKVYNESIALMDEWKEKLK